MIAERIGMAHHHRVRIIEPDLPGELDADLGIAVERLAKLAAEHPEQQPETGHRDHIVPVRGPGQKNLGSVPAF